MVQEELQLKKRLSELADKAYFENRYVYTNFLNEAEQSVLIQLEKTLPVLVTLEGGNPLAERKIAIFGEEDSFGYAPTIPFTLLHFRPVSKKFAEPISHRDVLGAVMHLGMEREMVGDIFINENEAYLFVMKQMAAYIMQELSSIRHTVVTIEELPLKEGQKLLLKEVKTCTTLVASLRVDAVVAAIYHLSRQESLQLFRDKKVAISGKIMENNSALLKEEQMVSVRGKGRFCFQGIVYETKKGKYQISYDLYM